jgi:glycosyltransferase involved in cell wall biosynthesis
LYYASNILKQIAKGQPLKNVFDILFVSEWWNLGSHIISNAVLQQGLPVLFAPWASLNPNAIGRDRRNWRKRLACRLISFWYGRKTPTLILYDEVDAEYAAKLGIRWPWTLGSLPIYTYPPHDSSFNWSAALNRNTENKRILFFNARLDIWQKGFDLLLEGFRQAAECAGKSFRTLLVLSGRAPDGPLASDGPKAEAMTRSLCNAGLAVWKGFISAEERRNMLAHADMFVYPSRVDGPPRPLREALWRNTPIMVTHETGFGTYVARYGAGIPIRSPDISAIRDAILQFNSASSEELSAMKKGAAKLAERLSVEHIVEDYELALIETIQKHRMIK